MGEREMTDTTLLPCPMCRAQLLFWTDTGCGDGYEHPDNGCYLSKAIVQPDRYAAWNRRDQWRPIESAPKDGDYVFATGLNYGTGPDRHYAAVRWNDIAWEDDDGLTTYHFLTHYMLITPPAPVSGGNK